MFTRIIEKDIDGNVIYDSLDNAVIEDVVSLKVNEIKTHAANLINDIEGDGLWKLRRAEYRGELDALNKQIDDVRIKSNALEAQVMNIKSKTQVFEFNVDNAFDE